MDASKVMIGGIFQYGQLLEMHCPHLSKFSITNFANTVYICTKQPNLS